MDDRTTALMAVVGMGSRRGNRRGISRLSVGGEPEPESQILEAVIAAVDLGADVNQVNAEGDTALHVAAENEHTTVVQFLVESGAEINAKNGIGLTPLGALLRRAQNRAPPSTEADDASELSSTVELLRALGANRLNRVRLTCCSSTSTCANRCCM